MRRQISLEANKNKLINSKNLIGEKREQIYNNNKERVYCCHLNELIVILAELI